VTTAVPSIVIARIVEDVPSVSRQIAFSSLVTSLAKFSRVLSASATGLQPFVILGKQID
jgi:hypothetical protein